MEQISWNFMLMNHSNKTVLTVENLPILVDIGGVFLHESGRYIVTDHLKDNVGIEDFIGEYLVICEKQ